jgi:hypothetical protein
MDNTLNRELIGDPHAYLDFVCTLSQHDFTAALFYLRLPGYFYARGLKVTDLTRCYDSDQRLIEQTPIIKERLNYLLKKGIKPSAFYFLTRCAEIAIDLEGIKDSARGTRRQVYRQTTLSLIDGVIIAHGNKFTGFKDKRFSINLK